MGFLDDLDRIDKEKSLMASKPQGGFLARLDEIDAEMQNKPLSSTVKDIGVSVGAGVPNVLGTLADVVDMATGDSIDVVGQFGDAAKGVGQQILNEGLSPETLAQRQAISQTVANENTGIGDVAMSMFKNPMGALTMGAESAATMLVPGGAGVGLAKAAPTIGKLVPRVANALTPARAGAIGATGANALLNAGDTFGELEGQALADRYLGASVPLAVSALLGPGMESMAVKRIIGAADTPVSNSIKEGLSNLGKGALKGGAKEFVSEAGEGGSQAVGEAIGKGEEINPAQVGKQAFLEGALGAAPGAVGGGLSNVKMAEPKNEPLEQIEQTVAKLVEDAQANQAQPEDVVANVLKALGGLDDKYQESKPQEKVAPEPVAEQTEQAPVVEEPQAQAEVRRIDRKVLQNRKRDDDDSVNQMRTIANNPDYGRVGYSRDFANGAPVVAFGSIPEEQKGRTDYAVAVTGERIPVQYAVVDADTVSTSNDINGFENPDYGLTDRVMAVAGNGRMTALGQAYRQGSAETYRQEMMKDSMHGVDPQVIAKMKNPVLVRIMPNERVRDDIGDLSNISTNKSLSAVEQARNDSRRVNLDALEFNEDGSITDNSLAQFVASMPPTERGAMMDKNGRPTSQAIDRVNNAIFTTAYNNDDIAAMYVQATDPEAKLVINALARLAPKMAKLEGCGELDFRDALVDAVNAIVQGKRKGLSMQDILAQQDFLADPDVALFIELFARNPRSNKDAVAILGAAADFAYEEATKSQEPDMLGFVQPKAERGDVMNYVRDEFNKVKEAKNGKQAKQQANVQDASGGIGASQNVDGRDTGANPRTNGREGLADSQADEGFSLTGQTEQEIIADEKAEEERQAQAEREAKADEERQEADNLRKEIDQRNEDYANDFTLEDDTVTGEDALRDQKPLFSRSANWKPEKELIEASKQFFGTTYNVNETGYVLPDGTMLDMSGRHETPKSVWPQLRGRRSIDHRMLTGENNDGFSMDEFFDDQEFDSQSDYMYNFMARTGAMRIDARSGVASCTRPPTPKQLAILNRALNGDEAFLAVYTPEGRIVDDVEFESSSPRKIKAWFAETFAKDGDTGIKASRKSNSYWDSYWDWDKAKSEVGKLSRLRAEIEKFNRSLKALKDHRVTSIAGISNALYEEFGLGAGWPFNPIIKQLKEDNKGKRVTLAMVVEATKKHIAELEAKRDAQQKVVDDMGGEDHPEKLLRKLQNLDKAQGLQFSRNPRTGKMDIKLSIAWHGSPHIFEVFLTDHIGTGEGAQAHGWGLYFAKDRDVAASYRKRLSRNQGGEDYEIYIGRREATEFYSWIEDQAIRSKSKEEARKWYDRLAVVEDLLAFEDASEVEARWEQYGEDAYTKEAYDWFNKEVKPKLKQPGRLFKLEIPDENLMLDEQKQFKDQPKHVQDALNRVVDNLIAEGVVDESFRDFIQSETGWGIYWSIGQKYDAKYGDDFDSLKAASLALNTEGIPGITYMGEEDGRCYVVFDDKAVKVLNYYSKNKPAESTPGSTVEDVTESLESDKDIGEAFATLRDSGEVNVVQSIEDLPEEIRSQIDGSKKSWIHAYGDEEFTVDSPVSHVNEHWNKSGFIARLEGAEGVRAGNIHLTLGFARNEHAGQDVVHAFDHARNDPYRSVDERSENDLVDDLIQQTIDDLRDNKVRVYTQKGGEVILETQKRAYVLRWSGKFGGYIIVTRTPSSDKNTKAKLESGLWKDRGNASLSLVHEAYTANAPSSVSRHQQGRNGGIRAESRSVEFNDSSFIADGRGGVKIGKIVIKRSDKGDIQGLYDPRTGKAYLIADALTDETAKPVFLHELGVHSAYGKNPLKLESQMKLARNMVNNGYAQGNEIAVRVKQRLFDAGEIDSMDDPIPMEAAEECLSYLVEETASTDDRGPFRKWFDSLMNAIKQWLRNHGINVNLNEWDFVEMAKGNVVAMARQSGKDMSLAYSKKSKKSDVRNKTIDRKGPSYKSDERYGRFTEGGFRPEVSDDVKALRERDKKEEDVQFWKIWDTDEMGNLRWEFGRLVSGTVGKTKLGKDAARLIGNASEAVLIATKMKRAPKGLRMQLRAMKAQIEQAGIDATEISKVMQKLTAEERSLISDYIENEMKADVHPAPYIVEIATKLTDILDKQADELVELGMLSKESRDRYRGHYLPRKYNKNKQENFFAKLLGSKSQMRGVAGGHLKGRGIFEEVPVEKVRTYISQGFEVRDPAYVYENGKVLHRQGQFEGMEAHNAKVLVWRDFSRAEREEMGEIRDASFRFAVGYMDTQRDLALGRLFKELASNPEYTSATARDGFEYIPKTEIPGTSGVFKYGALAGKYVDKTVLSHLAHIESSPNDFTRAFRQGMAFWKEGKTAMNPVSHMNNTVGNFTAAHFAGVNMWDMKTYNKAFNAMRNGNETFKEGQKAGLFTGSFSQEEFVKSLPQELQGNVKGEEGWFKSSGDLAMKILTWGMRDKMRKAYEFEDAFFKMAIYIKAREKGLSPEEAVDYAHQYVFVYDTLPQGARALRDWALPFFAWTYQAIPMLANTAAHYTHRMLVPALVLHAINKAFYMAAIAMASDEDEDWITLWKKASQLEDDVQETMPDYMSGYSALLTPKFLPVGINEATGLPRFFDMSHLIPGGNLFDVNNQMGGIPLPELIVPSHPVLNTVMALIGNRDSFTGRELYKDSDTDAEMLDTTAAYLWKQLSPALAFGNYHWSRLMDGVATATGKPILGYTGITKGGETITLDTAVLRFMGMKVRDYDAEKNAVKNINDNKRLMTEIKSGITRNRKDFGRGAITYEALDEFVKDQREKLERLAEANQKMSEAMGRIKANTKW